MPSFPTPALLETIVNSEAPCSRKAFNSSVGMPAPPNPDTNMVEPSLIPETAASKLSQILLIAIEFALFFRTLQRETPQDLLSYHDIQRT